MQTEQLGRLTSHYQKALKIKPNDSTYKRLAELYYSQNNIEQALEICQEALKVKSDIAWASSIFFELLKKLGFEQEDIAAYYLVLQEEPDANSFWQVLWNKLLCSGSVEFSNAKTWKYFINLGFTLSDKKLSNEAVMAFMEAIKIQPNLALSHYALSYVAVYQAALQEHELDQVVDFYCQLIQTHSVHSFAYAVLGDIFTQKGRLTEAITSYQSSINRDNTLAKKLPKKYRNSNEQVASIHFLIIGTGKSGSSSLYQYMCQHPQIIPAIRKEIHFFNSKFNFGIDWYLSHFPSLPSQGKFLTGEATPWYLGSDGVAEKIFQFFPNIKMLVILRDPVARAVSHYYMTVGMGEQRSLEEAMLSEIEALSDIPDSTQAIGRYWQTERGYLWCGLYAVFLEKWMTLFPREQFLILRTEQLLQQPAETIKQVNQFLGISNYTLPGYHKYNTGSYSSISRSLHQQLSDFFRPHNQKLEKLLDEKFNWK